MRDAVIVDAVRTPVGRRGGGLAATHSADLSAHVLSELFRRAGLDSRADPRHFKALKRSGLILSDIGVFEVIEAFAAAPVGPPVGGSGVRRMTTLVHHMANNGIRYGSRPCARPATAKATILERL